MTVFRCAEDQSRIGVHGSCRLESLLMMVRNSIEETAAIV